jgi:glycosyltransferase involved in cell wall biosynthesis/protein-tyrosine-phosphatase
MLIHAPALRVCQIATGDVWAGVETQLATAASDLVRRPEVELSAVVFNDGRLARELRAHGVPLIVLDESAHGALSLLRSLVRFFRAQHIDVVHTHGYKESVLGTLAARLAGVPHVIRTVHGLTEPLRGLARARMWVYQTVDRAVMGAFGDLVIAVSGRMVESLVDSGYRRAAIMRIYNGVDLRKVRPTRSSDEVRRELGIGRDALLIGTAGRLTAIKGHHYLLRAARFILDRQPNARFLIVGGGPLKDDLAATAARLELEDVCLFTGTREDVHDLIAAMDIFVLPSLDEGTPMSILEAMALQRPIVATAVGGLPEIISHGTTGLLVPARADRALAQACLELAGDREHARALGLRAGRVVEERFSHVANGAALVQTYQRVADSRPRGLLRRAGERLREVSRQARRRLSHPFETLRTLRLRRDPRTLVSRLRGARRVLIVCHGNIIRSPFACRLAAQRLNGHPVTIVSAGLGADADKPPHDTAVLLADEHGVSLGTHRAAPLTSLSVSASDVIFVMELAHLAEMRRRFPQAAAKTFLLSALAPETPLEIDDPYGRDRSVFEACFDQISRAVGPIARELAAGCAVRP